MGEWIKHDGGECPVHPNTRVDVIFRDGAEQNNARAGMIGHCWACGDSQFDVVLYRLSGNQDSMEEAYEDTDRPIGEEQALGGQVGGSHYLQFEIQPVEFINANNLDFLQGSVIKYVSRHKLKGGKADIEKAIHFCKLILELQYGA